MAKKRAKRAKAAERATVDRDSGSPTPTTSLRMSPVVIAWLDSIARAYNADNPDLPTISRRHVISRLVARARANGEDWRAIFSPLPPEGENGEQ